MTKQKLLSEILINGTPCNTTKLKKRLFNEGVKEYKCEKCGITEWMGEEIVLEIHHINGNHNDNRLENLQILCPNCHSQTPNFNGKSKGQKEEDAISKLIEREKERQEEIRQNKIYWGETPKYPKKDRTKICQYCGQTFIGRGEKYCSRKCAAQSSIKNEISIEQIYDAAATVPSLIQLGKIFNMTDNGIRKWLIKHDILDEIKTIMKNFRK